MKRKRLNLHKEMLMKLETTQLKAKKKKKERKKEYKIYNIIIGFPGSLAGKESA